MKIRGLRWWIIALVTLGTITNYLSRSTLGVAAPTFMKELLLTNEQYSYIIAAFNIAYAFGGPICGYFIDVIGLKFSFAFFAILWSLFNMAHGLVGGWQPMAALRVGMGLSEAVANPGGMKVATEWFPPKERGLACGIYSMGLSLGAMLSPPLVVWAIVHYSWQASFVITGVSGLVWTLLWLVFYHSPEKHFALTLKEKVYIFAQKTTSSAAKIKLPSPSFKKILATRNLWGIALPRFLADPAWGALHYWVPLYLITERHMNLKDIALYAWLPFLTADFGCLFSGFMTKFLNARGISVVNSRRITFTFAALMMVAMAAVPLVQSAYVAIGLFCLAGFAHQCLSITVITMSSDLFSKNEVATVTGCAAFFGSAGNSAFTLLIGALLTVLGYKYFFFSLVVFDLIGALLLWIIVKAPAETNDDSGENFLVDSEKSYEAF